MQINKPLVFPMPNLCTTGGSITVKSVAADVPAGGMHVVDWGTRKRFPGDGYTAADNGGAVDGLVSQFRGFGHHPIAAQCGEIKVHDELDISAATGSSRATMRRLVITYESGGSTRTLHASFELALCTTARCPEQKYS